MLGPLFRLLSVLGSVRDVKASLAAARSGVGRLKAMAEGYRTASFERTREKAAQGEAEALYELGEYYYQGRGVPLDRAEAFRCFLRAAGSGHGKAQLSVGLMLWLGRGVEADPPEAYKWLTLAADRGGDDACRARESARKKLPAEVVREGERRARCWGL